MAHGGVVIAVETDEPELRREADRVREQQDGASARESLTLAFRDDGVELRRDGIAAGRGFRVDFAGVDVRRHSKNLSRRQPLPRAIGRETETVADATAGFGHDAVLLALMGFDVTLVERSPVIAALLTDGVRRALRDENIGPALGDRVRVVRADARSWLDALASPPDVVYLDPMFPEKRKSSALPPLAAQLLRAVVVSTDDDHELFEVGRRVARRRVVVKRPLRADALGPGRSHAVAGKLVRYDVHPRPA